MAKLTTPQQLADDLKRRGGPKRPTMEQRQQTAQRLNANNNRAYTTQDNTALVQRLASLRTPVRAQGMGNTPLKPPQAPPVQPPYNPATYAAANVFDGSAPPVAPQRPSYQPSYNSYTPPAYNQPPRRYDPLSSAYPGRNPQAGNLQTMQQLISMLARLSGDEWTGNGTRAAEWEPPKPWMPDLWTLGGR